MHTSDEALVSRFEELRTWLFVVSVISVCSVLVLTNVTKPQEMAGLMLVTNLIMALPVFYAFHRCALVEEIRVAMGREGGGIPYAVTPPCNGFCGYGGTTPSFFSYAASFSIVTYKLTILYSTCAFNTFRYKLSPWDGLMFFTATILMLAALFFVELGKHARTNPYGSSL